VELEPLEDLIGETGRIREVREALHCLGPLDTTVLVTGETGAGKGVCARLLHRLSARSGAFVHADCASLAPTLLESELFGHERGAFTGAVVRRAGRLERAAAGTLFLDEIGELERPQQARLLSVLEERRFERLGGAGPLALTARVVAATSRDLAEEVRRGRFRADLYYRIAVARIELPPLRERRADVPLLAKAGLRAIAGRLGLAPPRLSEEALARLVVCSWPGNVRELFNALERLTIRRAGRAVTLADLEDAIGDPIGEPPSRFHGAGSPHRQIAEALRESEGNVARAARDLGIPRSTLRRRIARLGASAPGSALAGRGDSFEDHQSQGDQGEHRLVETNEPRLGHVPEDPASHPRSGDDGEGEQEQGRRVVQEGEPGDAEDRDLRQMAEGLAGGLRADDLLARHSQVEEEGRQQGAGRPDGLVQDANHATEGEEPAIAFGVLGVCAQSEEAGRPGRQQDEDADQAPGEGRRERGRDCEPEHSHRKEQRAVAQDQRALDVVPLDPGPGGVRDELHRAVKGDGLEGREEDEHDREQHDAPGHADDAGQDRREERRYAEDRERFPFH
jgi:transcriptional regulator with AAA-type ATPase domain